MLSNLTVLSFTLNVARISASERTAPIPFFWRMLLSSTPINKTEMLSEFGSTSFIRFSDFSRPSICSNDCWMTDCALLKRNVAYAPPPMIRRSNGSRTNVHIFFVFLFFYICSSILHRRSPFSKVQQISTCKQSSFYKILCSRKRKFFTVRHQTRRIHARPL